MGKTIHEKWIQSHHFQQIGYLLLDLLRVAAIEIFQRLRDNLSYREAWIKRAIGVLEYHLHSGPLLPNLTWWEFCQVFSFENNASCCRFDQLQNSASRG